MKQQKPCDAESSGLETVVSRDALVVFDFDGTLYSEDSFASFIRWRIFSSGWRIGIALLLLPALLFIRYLPGGRRRYASAFLWVASLGCNLNQLEEQMAVYVYRQALDSETGHFFADGLAQLFKHQQLGHRVVIATGAAEALVQLLLQSQRISNVLIIGSRLRNGWGGVLCEFHCYQQDKQQAVASRFSNQAYAIVYSDSLADLPILSQASHAVMVNANSQLKQRVMEKLPGLAQGITQVHHVTWS